jgi:hypothetical protein
MIFAASCGRIPHNRADSAEKRVCAGELGRMLECVGYKFGGQSEHIAIYSITIYHYNYIYL